MTTRTFRPYDPDELWLLASSLREWLPEDHLAYFLSDLVEALNLHPILATYGDVTRGTAPYHPQLLVKVLLYAYAVWIPASRQIARKLEQDVALRVPAANQRSDFWTFSDFQKQHLPALADLFVQILRLCQRVGLVKLGHLAVAGTKVKANVSKHKAMSYGRMRTEETRLTAEVERLLAEAEVVDAREDAADGRDQRGDELPAELARQGQRLKTIRAAKAVLEQEAHAEATLKQVAHEARTADGPRQGRPPQPPSAECPIQRLSATSRTLRVGLCRMLGPRGVSSKDTTVRPLSMHRCRSLSQPTPPMKRMTHSKPNRCCPRCSSIRRRSPEP